MNCIDSIYGSITIENQLIIDLIQSKPMQRLKHISQDGAVHYMVPSIKVTRYDHSIGTWYLSNKFERPLEEQVASLLHDIPHTAFSHVIDFVMEDRKHEYHDRFLKQIIMDSEIPDILKKHNLDIKKVLAKESFPLLDNDLPDISFDRLDYFLRDGFSIDILPRETIELFLHEIKEEDKKFFFEDISVASMFAILFMNCSRLYWLSPNSHGAFFLISRALKIALQKGTITEKDFFTTDNILMKKMKKTHDTDILSLLTRLQPGKYFRYASKDTAEFYGPNKPRFVDPWIKNANKLQLLSDLKPEFKEYFTVFVRTHTYLGVTQQR